MFSATSDLGKSKLASDKKPPGEMLKLIYIYIYNLNLQERDIFSRSLNDNE